MAIGASRKVSESNIVLFPTDTLYGLGVDATDAEAVARLIELKGRNEGKPISIIVADMAMAAQYAHVTPLALKLAQTFLPGKLTVVLEAKDTLPQILTAGTGTVGIRIPAHPIPLKLARELGKPITATSANVADLPTLAAPQEILGQFGEKAGMVTQVIDEGALPESKPSTVVDARGEVPLIIREGAILEDDVLASV